MNLAARCTACATVFRVVQDQLRVSDGWVRCGRCGEVFNAIENLVDVDVALPERTDAGAPEVAVGRVDTAPAAQAVGGELADVADVAGEGSVTGGAAGSDEIEAPAPLMDSAAPAVAGAGHAVFEAHAVSVAPVVAAPAVTLPLSPSTSTSPLPSSSPSPPPSPSPQTPRFVRRADRAARWQRPRVRLALGAAALLLVLALGLQLLFEFRDTIAGRWPATRPALQAACGIAGCSVGAARWIEVLAVDSSGLVRIEGTALYRLSVTVRNRSEATVAVPALDLSLTDAQGGLTARRVIEAAETGVAQQTLDPRSELVLQATLAMSERPVAGYTIELFYP